MPHAQYSYDKCLGDSQSDKKEYVQKKSTS